MQIAKMFASLGFKVDTTGLKNFKKALGEARSELTNLNRGAKNSTRQLRSLRREADKVSSSLGKIRGAGANGRASQGYSNMAGSVHKLNNALNSIVTNRQAITRAIGKINSSVIAGAPHWERYRESVVRSRIALRNLNGDLARLRANSRIDIRVRNQGGGGAGGGGGGAGGGLGGAVAGLGLRGFLGNMIPAMALGGIGAGAGFAAVGTVEAARDQTRMESMILMTSKSASEFSRTIDYVRNEAERLGLSSTELGKSFAQINMSAEGLSQGTKEQMFTGFSEFMMSMGTSADDQKGIFRAFNQMFSNNRILQEEINQLSDRGIPATLVYDAAMKAYDTKSIQKIKKLQEDGKLDPKRVLPIMAQMVQDLAHDSGSYAKMMESSIVKQGKFYEQLRQTSKEIMDSGLDVYLGKLFGELTKLVVVIGDAAQGLGYLIGVIKDANNWFNEVAGSNTLLNIAVLALLFRFKGLARGIRSATRLFLRNRGVVASLTALFRGAFGMALGRIVLATTGWGVAIWGVISALQFLWKEVSDDKYGWTIFDELKLKMELTGMEMEILGLKWEHFWLNIKSSLTNQPEWMKSAGRALGFDMGDVRDFEEIHSIRSQIKPLQGISPYKTNGILPKTLKDQSFDMTNIQGIIQNAETARENKKNQAVVYVTVNNQDGSSTQTKHLRNIMNF